MDAQPEIGELFDSYCNEINNFVKPEDAVQDVSLYVDRLTKGHQYLSRKYVAKIDGINIFEHYKMRHTYMYGMVLCKKKKQPRFVLTMCNYIKGSKGIIYYIKTDNDERLMMFTGHYFDRLQQRLGLENEREKLIHKTMEMLQISEFYDDEYPLLLDKESFQAYQVFKDGYGAGEHMKFKADGNFPRNKSGTVTVVFLKTFLTDTEISPEKMDGILELYRRRNGTTN